MPCLKSNGLPKKERVLHCFELTEADGDPGSFSGLVLVSQG